VKINLSATKIENEHHLITDKKMDTIFNNLFVFEMANNHIGDVEHGLKIIREIYQVSKKFSGRGFKFGFKLQYRHLDTFIHPDFKTKTDIKYVKRFQEARLNENQLEKLKDEITNLGFVSICTPFDENSVDLIEKHKFDIIKIGSCSFTDWFLLEKIAKTNKPIIASTAGVSLDEIDKVVSFFKHRGKQLAIMHCVGEYPTKAENLQLNQIDLFVKRYPNIPIGFSTHEDPDNIDSIKIAIAKGASVFERHVTVVAKEFPKNAYSSTPEQISKWLESADLALQICGICGERAKFTKKELADVRQFKRGVFASKKILKGEKIDLSNTFFAFPNQDNQVVANDMSKYTEFNAKKNFNANEPIMSENVKLTETREKIYSIVQKVKKLLKKGKVVVPGQTDLEISHPYGIDRFDEYGITMTTVVNREYCKKLIIILPNQKHPEQYHKEKEETFVVIYGDILLSLDGKEKKYGSGEIITIKRDVKHSFTTKTGAIIEEISSTHYKDDSYYTDKTILKNKNRKTFLSYWIE